ncbi:MULTISPECIES: two-component regulator propeller domain-containing protein [unclassified Carboxylicivirga]|uniref:hybrid sensor histidine kinase/response regulator n=1 Tax=Carboxylicivirga TaxID=1628153 RepID=UPI003D340250
MHKFLLWIFLVCLMTMGSNAMPYDISAEYLTMQNGLSDNNVNCLLKDHKGFIWLGTADGLNRYDGFAVKSFKPFDGPLDIYSLHQATTGLIWVGTNDGMYAFDTQTERFIFHYRAPHAEAVTIRDIDDHPSGGLLIASEIGLAHLHFSTTPVASDTTSLRWITPPKMNNTSAIVLHIAHDKEGIVWLGTSSNELIRFNCTNNTFEHYQLPKKNKKTPYMAITSLRITKQYVMVSTIGDGLLLFDKSTHNTLNITHPTLSHNDTYGIVKQKDGDYWIATWDGLDQLSTLSHAASATHYNWSHPALSDQFENRIISILNDASGVLWLGTHGGGAVKINLKKRVVHRINFNSYYEVKSFASDENKHLYVSIYHGGIKKSLNPFAAGKKLEFTDYNSQQKRKKNRLPSDIILSSVNDKRGHIWFGTLQSSLLRYNTRTDDFREVKVRVKDDPHWRGRVNCLFIDSHQRFWLGTSRGLLLYDRTSQQFTRIKGPTNGPGKLSGHYIRAIHEDAQGRLWIGTNEGLNEMVGMQYPHYQFRAFNDANTSPLTLANKAVWALHEMANGELWIAYRGGLGYLSAKADTIAFLTKKDGLCHNFTTCLTGQNDSLLWIGTNSGISRLNTNTKSFSNYYFANNLRAVHRFADGTLIWGNNKGLLYFHPDSLRNDDYTAKVQISDIAVNNERIKVGDEVNKHIVMTQAAPYTKSLTLHPPISSFSIHFVALSYLNQANNQYEYRLKNHNDSWVRVAGHQRSVTYNNLAPGRYTFEVRAANSDGVWSQDITQLTIHIVPPWHKTWPGRILIALSIIMMITLAFGIRLRRIYREQQINAEKEKLEYALKLSKIEQNKQQELSEMKARFFTNISHELRTPLTLILSPLKELLSRDSLDASLKSKLELINRHAGLLHQLISQLLDFRKTEKGEMPLRVQRTCLIDFTKNIIGNFESLAHTRHIQIKTQLPNDKVVIWCDPEKLRIMLSNLLSNAIKYSPDSGNIYISIEETASSILLKIRDEGPGVDTAYHDAIFKRFYQTGQAPADTDTAGTGIGLALVREYAELHGGSIRIDSRPGQGSTFILQLLKGRKHLKDATFDTPASEEKVSEVNMKPMKEDSTLNSEELPPILIVEDHKELREYLREMFSDTYSVHEAGNGHDALDKLRKNKDIRAVISDVMMPLMDGMTLCNAIKTDVELCHLPVILLTAKSEETDTLKGLETGADAYITKPFSPPIVLTTLSNLLKNRIGLKQYYSSKITLGPTEVEIEPAEEIFIRSAIEYVETHLTDPGFSAEVLAELLNISQATLYRRIKTITGDNISVFIRSIRLKRAAQLLKQSNDAVADISMQIGFNDVAYFRRCFTKQFGMPPSSYRKEKR